MNQRIQRSIYCIAAAMGLAATSQAVTLSPGDLVVVDGLNDSVIKVDPVSGAQELISQGNLIDLPLTVAVDAAGNVYATSFSIDSGKIIRVDAATGAQTLAVFLPGLNAVQDLALDRAGNIFSAGIFGAGGGRIMKVSPVMQHQTPVAGGDLSIAIPGGICVGSGGSIYIAEYDADLLPGVEAYSRILRANQSTGALDVVAYAGYISQVVDVLEDDDGSILALNSRVWQHPNGPTSILRVDPATGNQVIEAIIPAQHRVIHMDREFSGSIVYVAQDPAVRRIDLATGEITTVSSGGLIRFATDVFVIPDGLEPSKQCLGDTDGNGVINVNDITSAVFHLGSTTAPAAFDTDGSGMVDVHDLTMIIFRLGTVCEPK